MADQKNRITQYRRVAATGVAVALTASLAHAGGFAGYTQPVNWQAGQRPTDVQAADLDGDGHIDLLSTDQQASMLTVVRGVGDGTFLPPVSRLTIIVPDSVTLADLNGDNRPDAVVTSTCSFQIAIHLNLGDGTFGEPTYVTFGDLAGHVAAGDFNGDGHVDLFVAEIYSRRVTLLLGDGSGAVQASQTFALAYYPWCIESADVNGDGADDLGIGLFSGGQLNFIRMIVSDSQGGFLPPVDTRINRQPVDLAFGDFNQDHVPDCVTIDSTAGIATVLTGTGKGSFVDARFYPFNGQPEEVEAFDVNNDGIDDVVAAHSYFHRVTTMVGTGDGDFLDPIWQDVGMAFDLAHADFDGNGFQDIVVGHDFGGGNMLTVLLNRSVPGAAAQLMDVQATTGRIIFGPVEDIRYPDNVTLRAQAFATPSIQNMEQIDLHVSAQTDNLAAKSLNLTVLSKVNREKAVQQVRLYNWTTGAYDVVMLRAVGTGDAYNTVMGVNAAPYVNQKGMIDMSIRCASLPQFGAYPLEAYLDWVDIAVE